MSEAWKRGLPTWMVVLTAIVAPFVFAVLFLTALDAVHLPPAGSGNPDAGYIQSGYNDAVVLVYGLVQLAFLIVAPWVMTQRAGARVAFFAIAVPLCLLLSLIAVVSQIAG